MRRWIPIALSLSLAALPSVSLADEPKSLEELVVDMADTPAEHAAVAAHFRHKAERARAAAKRHESMGRSYGGGKLQSRVQMSEHCRRLAEQNAATAAEYEALAKLHDDLAKAAP
jgi:hypothetical protein